jgi:hypothetical protein
MKIYTSDKVRGFFVIFIEIHDRHRVRYVTSDQTADGSQATGTLTYDSFLDSWAKGCVEVYST